MYNTIKDVYEDHTDLPADGVTCAYCGRSIPAEDEELVPAVDDDDEWGRLAVDHDADCEWVVSRSFRRA